MTTTNPTESDLHEPREVVSAGADDWMRQFIKFFELQLLEAGRDLPPNASVSDSQAATARAFLAASLDSGLALDSAATLLGQAVIGWRSGHVAWSEAMNQRRFVLIDKEIQETLTPAESIELAGLTGSLREHVETETNLSFKGAQALHEKLLQLDSMGESE